MKTYAIAPVKGVAIAATVIGAIGSMVLMFHVGDPPFFLRMLFVIWVLSPFALLLAATALSGKWSEQLQVALTGAMMFVPVVSLAIYALTVYGPPRSKPVAAFVAVPPASWLVIAGALLVAAFMSRRQNDA